MIDIALLVALMILSIVIGATILRVRMLVDCATKEPSEGNDKIVSESRSNRCEV